MTGKLHSLRGKGSFRLLFQRGKRIDSPLFRVIYRPNDLGFSRLALVTSKAVDRRSSIRNRIKRRAREWIRKNQREFAAPPADMAIIFKKEAGLAERKIFYGTLKKVMGQRVRP